MLGSLLNSLARSLKQLAKSPAVQRVVVTQTIRAISDPNNQKAMSDAVNSFSDFVSRIKVQIGFREKEIKFISVQIEHNNYQANNSDSSTIVQGKNIVFNHISFVINPHSLQELSSLIEKISDVKRQLECAQSINDAQLLKEQVIKVSKKLEDIVGSESYQKIQKLLDTSN